MEERWLLTLYTLYLELTWISANHSSDAVVVYEGASESSRTGPRVVSCYDDFDSDF